MVQVFSTTKGDFIGAIHRSEKELNDLLTRNFGLFFPNLIHIKSEFTLNGIARSIGTSGRIDIFAFNSQTNRFVIIELKIDLNKNMRSQANDYRDFIEDNFADIYICVLQDHEIKLPKKKEIVSDSFELILIAQEFGELDKPRKNREETTFIKYKWLEGDFILFEYLNNEPSFSKKELATENRNQLRPLKEEPKDIHDTSIIKDVFPKDTKLTIINRGGVKAFGQKCSDGRFIVFKGSKIRDAEAPNLSTSASRAHRERKKLRSNGSIDNSWVLTTDIYFNSISLAAKVVLGTSADGSQWQSETMDK